MSVATAGMTLDEVVASRVTQMLLPVLVEAVRNGVGEERLSSLEKAIKELEKQVTTFSVRAQLLSPEDVVKITTYSIQTINRRIKTGDFPPAFERGAITRWRRKDVEAYLDGKWKSGN